MSIQTELMWAECFEGCHLSHHQVTFQNSDVHLSDAELAFSGSLSSIIVHGIVNAKWSWVSCVAYAWSCSSVMHWPTVLSSVYDVSVVKGYLRKGASLVAIKEYSRAADVYQKAIDLDANCQEAIDAYRTWVEMHSLSCWIFFCSLCCLHSCSRWVADVLTIITIVLAWFYIFIFTA